VAVTVQQHGEWFFGNPGKDVLVARDLTLILTDDEGGLENPLTAQKLGYKTVVFCSNAGTVSGVAVMAIAGGQDAGIQLTTQLAPSSITGYNGTIRLFVVGTI
jgi:hypothetical protein